MNIIRIVYCDVQEKIAVNKAMMKGEIDLSLFETSPLVGCYLVCCAYQRDHEAFRSRGLDGCGRKDSGAGAFPSN